MAEKPTSKSGKNAEQTRDDRLKAALKANLARRKAQSRVRAQVADQKSTAPGVVEQDKDV